MQQAAQCARLHGHHRHRMGDDVMQFPGDALPLLGHRPLGRGCLLLLQRQRRRPTSRPYPAVPPASDPRGVGRCHGANGRAGVDRRPATGGLPHRAGAARPALILLLGAGLIWQFVLVIGLVFAKQRSLRWPVLRDALWLRQPRSPSTGRVGGRLWLVLIPLTVGLAAEEAIPQISHPLPVISAQSCNQIPSAHSCMAHGSGSRSPWWR
jgi:hypothetical protein